MCIVDPTSFHISQVYSAQNHWLHIIHPTIFWCWPASQLNPHGAILQVLVEMSHSHEDVYEDTTAIHAEGALDAGSEAGHRNNGLAYAQGVT